MNIEKHIRKLARSTFFQNLYISSKDCGNLQLFQNTNNYSGLQVLFLYWLSVYEGLYQDVLKQDYKYLDDKVIQDDDRCDAFLYFRRKQQEREISAYQLDKKVQNTKLSNKENATVFDIDFRREV